MTSDDCDTRLQLFVGLTRQNLTAVAARWPRSGDAPANVLALLGQARRLFIGGHACYDNFLQSELVALQAAEAGIRDVLAGEVSGRATLGQLARSEAAERRLTPRQLLWLREFAVAWRNRLAHPGDALAVTPAMAAELLDGVHHLVSELYSAPRSG